MRKSILKFDSADECPDAEKLHTKAPTGYLSWGAWADDKRKTHRQIRCPTCGFWAIWVKKEDKSC